MTTVKLFTVSALCALQLQGTNTPPWAEDAVSAFYAEYLAAQKSERISESSPEERRVFYEAWLGKSEEVARENPESPWLYTHRDARLELYNVLGRFSESVSFVEAQLARMKQQAGSLPGEYYHDRHHAGLLGQVGSLARDAWLVTRDDSYARKSVESFRAAHRLFARHNDVIGMINATMGEGYMQQASGNHGEAASLYVRAYELLSQVPDNQKQYMDSFHLGLGANSEQLLSEAALEYAKAQDAEKSLEIFKLLEQIPARNLSRAVYLQSALQQLGYNACVVLCPYIETWIEQHPNDEHAPPLVHDLAFNFSRAGRDFDDSGLSEAGRINSEKAIKWFERFLEYGEAPGSSKFPVSVVQEVYREMANLNERIGESDRAAALREKLEKRKQ